MANLDQSHHRSARRRGGTAAAVLESTKFSIRIMIRIEA